MKYCQNICSLWALCGLVRKDQQHDSTGNKGFGLLVSSPSYMKVGRKYLCPSQSCYCGVRQLAAKYGEEKNNGEKHLRCGLPMFIFMYLSCTVWQPFYAFNMQFVSLQWCSNSQLSMTSNLWWCPAVFWQRLLRCVNVLPGDFLYLWSVLNYIGLVPFKDLVGLVAPAPWRMQGHMGGGGFRIYKPPPTSV